MKRIDRLRLQALENKACYDEFFYKFYKCYDNSPKASFKERYAEAFLNAFCDLKAYISEDELIVGKCMSKFSEEEKEEWNKKYSEIAYKNTLKAGGGQDSHMSIDYELVLKYGVNGIIEKINVYLLNCDESKKAFYQACKMCLEAVIKHSQNYANAADKLRECEKNEERRKELKKIAAICRKVPANPAESFYEAVQSVNFITYCLGMNPFRLNSQQFQLGHPDRYLLPYYLKDIENGIITKEFAQELLDCLGIQINNRVPSGVSSGYMVGGRDENGKMVANDLTYMGMQVVEDIKLAYPAVGLCYTEGMDDVFLEKACDILMKGCSHPAIFNDDIITEGLIGYGVPEKEAHNYIHSTCVEITPVGSSNAWVASPYTNMPQLLLDIMDREYESFNELMAVLFKRIDKTIEDNFKKENAMRGYRSNNSINPLLSCFVNDCLVNGTDIEQGGARYNWIMPSFVGMANLVDSLYVIKNVVFDKTEISILKLKQILDRDFEGEESLRLRFLNHFPKYGNDIDEIDMCFGLIVEHIVNECKKYKGNYKNSRLIPSAFCWIMHDKFGREMGATPDGRKAGFPLADGSGPCQGRELKGPTAAVLSSTKWRHRELIGGVAVNMKFSKKSLGKNSLGVMKSIVKTYLKRGGFEIQINITDRETLEKALENPEGYRDLVVRIGGYSDYFVKLSPGMQQEVILRTEHKI